jgi:hypothetical protein
MANRAQVERGGCNDMDQRARLKLAIGSDLHARVRYLHNPRSNGRSGGSQRTKTLQSRGDIHRNPRLSSTVRTLKRFGQEAFDVSMLTHEQPIGSECGLAVGVLSTKKCNSLLLREAARLIPDFCSKTLSGFRA